tara:strand:- start:926 stop:1396 length:471 start_codon:yes stop_codon:yes gene_type:complete
MSFLKSLVGPVADLLSEVIPDSDMRMKLAAEIDTLASRQATELAKGQLEVNKEEAKSASMFVAGWRPFIGWICGMSFCMHFILIPFGNFALLLSGSGVVLPGIDLATMMPVLGGMLGLGGLRTFEKVKGASKNQPSAVDKIVSTGINYATSRIRGK